MLPRAIGHEGVQMRRLRAVAKPDTNLPDRCDTDYFRKTLATDQDAFRWWSIQGMIF
jgi:hypothetical protein